MKQPDKGVEITRRAFKSWATLSIVLEIKLKKPNHEKKKKKKDAGGQQRKRSIERYVEFSPISRFNHVLIYWCVAIEL